jgi:hypothetical protein
MAWVVLLRLRVVDVLSRDSEVLSSIRCCRLCYSFFVLPQFWSTIPRCVNARAAPTAAVRRFLHPSLSAAHLLQADDVVLLTHRVNAAAQPPVSQPSLLNLPRSPTLAHPARWSFRVTFWNNVRCACLPPRHISHGGLWPLQRVSQAPGLVTWSSSACCV